jgi:hypothetical protein
VPLAHEVIEEETSDLAGLHGGNIGPREGVEKRGRWDVRRETWDVGRET